MAQHPEHRGGAWQSAKRLSGRTPLRVKLIAAVLILVTAALAVISIASIAFLRGYLLGQADKELALFVSEGPFRNQPVGVIKSYLSSHQAYSSFSGPSYQWITRSGKVMQAQYEISGVRRNGLPIIVPGPSVHASDSWISHTLVQSTPVTVRAIRGGGLWRVSSFKTPLSVFNPANPTQTVTGTVVVGVDVTSVYRTLSELTIIDAITSCLLLLVLAVFGIALIRTSLRPLNDIERTAQAIAAGDLSRRVPERDPRTEVGRLGRALNTMLAQIESAFHARTASEEAAHRSEETARRSEENARHAAFMASRSEDRMRQFVADASHELRTPLTAIRGYAEYYRQRGGTEGEAGGADASRGARTSKSPNGHVKATPAAPAAGGQQSQPAGASAGESSAGKPSDADRLSHADLDRIFNRVEQEATRMGVLVDDMLLLARLDMQRPMDVRTVDLLAISADALHDARVIAPARAINLTVDTADAPLVLGDEVGLRQVVGNLMSNAIKHTQDGTPIDITIRTGTLGSGQKQPAQPENAALEEPAVILEVTDQGPGLTAEQKDRVFERFYRTDRARSRSAGGTGLGLAIVAAQVSAHRGRVWVDSEPGHGATFGLALPLAPEARQSD